MKEKRSGREGARAAREFVTAPGVQPITGKQLLCSSNNCPLPIASSHGGNPPPAEKGKGSTSPAKASGYHSPGHRLETVARLLADVLQEPQH